MAVTTEEAKLLMMSAELAAVEEVVAARVGLPLLRDSQSEGLAIDRIVTHISEYTEFTVSDVLQRLRSDSELLIRFWVAFYNDSAENEPAEEHPRGEGPDPEALPQRVQTLGLSSGFGVVLVVWLHFLRERPKPQLAGYLKDTGKPHAAKFATNLRRIYEFVAGPSQAG